VASRIANLTIRKTPPHSNSVSLIERFVEWLGQHFHSKYGDTASRLDQMVCRSVPKSKF
jgi:hypothetical protein